MSKSSYDDVQKKKRELIKAKAKVCESSINSSHSGGHELNKGVVEKFELLLQNQLSPRSSKQLRSSNFAAEGSKCGSKDEHGIGGTEINNFTNNGGLIASFGSKDNPVRDDSGISDDTIGFCNAWAVGQDGSRIAKKVWDLGKSIGVTHKGNQETIVDKLIEMEARDKEAVSGYKQSRSTKGCQTVLQLC